MKSLFLLFTTTLALHAAPDTFRETFADPATRPAAIATLTPLPGTYIKVFAENRDGSISFHKDGYTDLRGKFDYLSHTATDPATIRRLAILVSHKEKGSLTRITK